MCRLDEIVTEVSFNLMNSIHSDPRESDTLIPIGLKSCLVVQLSSGRLLLPFHMPTYPSDYRPGISNRKDTDPHNIKRRICDGRAWKALEKERLSSWYHQQNFKIRHDDKTSPRARNRRGVSFSAKTTVWFFCSSR